MSVCLRAGLASLALLFLASATLAKEPPTSVEAVGHKRMQVYHSPQTPGYTCWVGTWTMPDKSLMVSFGQATGPMEREKTPQAVRDHMNWPPPGRGDSYDMNGLDLRSMFLRSQDNGQTWKETGSVPYKSCMNGITSGQCEPLKDGSLIRGVWGQYLPFDKEVPKTGCFQFSKDNGKSWGELKAILDPKKVTTWPKKFQRLRDGRLLLIAGGADMPAGKKRYDYDAVTGAIQPLLMVSGDEGKSWSKPLLVVPQELRGKWGGEEFALAELDNGDLFGVFRTLDPATGARVEVRWQGLLKKEGKSWKPVDFRPAPFPHSGQPYLLSTQEGVILHVATSGIHWTADAGAHWAALTPAIASSYYPAAVQTADGTIHLIGHIGGDDGYGDVDQSIVDDSFKLKVK